MLEQTKLLRVPLWIGNRNHNHKCYIMFTSYLHCRFCRILELTSTVHVCTTSTYFTNIFSSNKRKKCPASAWAVLHINLGLRLEWYSENCGLRRRHSYLNGFKWFNKHARTSMPLKYSKSAPKWSIKSARSTLLHRLVLLSVCFINPMSVRYSTNWDQKGWPDSEIKMYYGCPWSEYCRVLQYAQKA